MAGLLVLKLGGSLYESDRLGEVLPRVARAGRPVVVVPGGGPFADAVRAEHAAGRITETTAHDLAVLAMQQMGRVLSARQTGFALVDTDENLAWASRTGQPSIWMPERLTRNATTIARNWSMTSDGLAAWLAARLTKSGIFAPVVLVKSCPIPEARSAADLAELGIVDPWFPRIVAEHQLAWRVISAGDGVALDEVLGLTVDGSKATC